jgi:regulator of protease activity HflC (stomatin/prohibitin superfamily)
MKISAAIVAFILLSIVLVIAFGSWGTIEAGNCGVVLRMGAVTGEIKPPGFYTKMPFSIHVVEMNVQVQKEQVDTQCSSKDLQTVKATVSLNLSLMQDKAASVYQNIGIDYLETVVAPAMQESVKSVMAQYTAEELKTEAINIVDFDFSSTFNEAIEAKVTAEQNALAAKNKLEQVKYEADQSVAMAEGQAKAIAIQAQAIQVQGGEAYIQLKALEKWDGKLPQIMGAGTVPFINTALK